MHELESLAEHLTFFRRIRVQRTPLTSVFAKTIDVQADKANYRTSCFSSENVLRVGSYVNLGVVKASNTCTLSSFRSISSFVKSATTLETVSMSTTVDVTGLIRCE